MFSRAFFSMRRLAVTATNKLARVPWRTVARLTPLVAMPISTVLVGASSIKSQYADLAQHFKIKPEEKPMTLFTEDHKVQVHKDMEALVRRVQQHLINCIEEIEGPDGARFLEEFKVVKEGEANAQEPMAGLWNVRILQKGKVFAKAGCNVSITSKTVPRKVLERMSERIDVIKNKLSSIPENATADMYTASISLVFHANNPNVPTVHANFRFFDLHVSNGENIWWFGGGTDLTPMYLNDEDATYFHNSLKRASDKHNPAFYPAWKKECDHYFWNVHRREARGVGGVFFDNFQYNGSKDDTFKVVKDMAESIAVNYFPIVERNKLLPFTAKMDEWKRVRWSKYVEFNLMYDAGTKYGFLTAPHRYEAILMSMPPEPVFMYKYQHGPEEEKLQQVLRTPRAWASSQ